MPARRRVEIAAGEAAVAAWRADHSVGRSVLATAVRFTLEELGARAPGRSVEVRVPPLGAVQCIEGPRHTRGTPPNVVEAEPQAWLEVATGERSWEEVAGTERLRFSGTRSDLTEYLPLA